MKALNLPIENVAPFVPQSGEMVLLDRVTNFGDNFLQAEVTVRADHLLMQNGVLPTFAGIEMMAQGIAAWAGIQAYKRNEPVRLGYLLGTRKLHIYQAVLPVGTVLEIHIKESIQDAAGFGVFDCRLIDKVTQKTVSEGALNVFSPKDGKIQK